MKVLAVMALLACITSPAPPATRQTSADFTIDLEPEIVTKGGALGIVGRVELYSGDGTCGSVNETNCQSRCVDYQHAHNLTSGWILLQVDCSNSGANCSCHFSPVGPVRQSCHWGCGGQAPVYPY